VTELGTTLPTDDITISLLIVGMMFSLILGAGLVVDVILAVRFLAKPPKWASHLRALRARPWTWMDCAGLFCILTGVVLGMSLISALCPPHDEAPAPLILFFRACVLHIVALVAIIAIIISRKLPINRALGIRWNKTASNVGQGITFYLGIMPVIGVAAFAYAFLLRTMDLPIDKQEVLRWFSDPAFPTWFRVGLILIAVVVAPIVEELVFRGIALPAVMKHSRPWLAVCFISLVFASVHSHLPSLVPLFLLAVGFSVAYIHSESILVPIVMHATFNTMSLIAHFLLKEITIFG
jgi:membrane protease YdiL (CAAX protease family)